jgi:AcrR family transcriptional regulator
MTRRSTLKAARNQPQQPRSRATVSVILDGAIRVLDQQGLEAMTTSRVAEVAGVSVGTLYQYFAHRDAIIDALQDRELERASEMLQRVLSNPHNASDREVASAVIAELLRLRYGTPERVLAFDVRSVALVKAFLSMAGPRLRQANLEAAAFVIYQSVRATMLSYLLENPAGVADEVIVAEVTELVVRYLQA